MESESYTEKYVEYYDLLREDKGYSEECDFIEACIKNYSKIPVQAILDLGSGTGNHSKYLSERGYIMTGIDLSKGMVRIANLKNMPNCKFIVGNMIDFDLKNKFDLVICMYAAFGYVTKNKDVESAVKSIKRHLKPGGLFIFDCWNGLAVMNELPSSRIKEAERDGLYIKRISYPNLDAFNHVCEVNFDVQIKRGESVVDNLKEKHLVRFFFPQEIRKYLEDGGFEVVEICPAFQLGKKATEKNWWMAVVARLDK